MNQELKIGIVGCGGISRAHVRAYQNITGARIVEVFDIHRPNEEALAQELGVGIAASLEEMAQADGLDAVSICTPPGTHLETCAPFLQAGVPVLSEKPFEISLDRAQQLAAAVRQSGTPYMIAFCHRFHPPVQEARRLLREETERIGQPLFFRNMFGGSVDISGGHRSVPELSGGGVLIDNGAHSLDLFRFLVGEAKAVRAQIQNLWQPARVEDFAAIELEGDRCAAQITGSYSLPAMYNSIEIFCTKSTLSINYGIPGRPELALFAPGQGERALPVEAAPDRFTAEVAHFLDCVRSGTAPSPNVDDALANTVLIDAAYRSAREGRRIAVA